MLIGPQGLVFGTQLNYNYEMDVLPNGSDHLSPLQRAYYMIQKLKAELAKRGQTLAHAPVAVIGMACRFPGGIVNQDGLWEMLRAGQSTISEVPLSRWDKEAWYALDTRMPGKMNSKWAGFCQHIEQFDASFFGISPREAYHLDPQQRLLLMVAWEALENAGILPVQLQDSGTGVFIGQSSSDYLHQLLHTLKPEEIGPYLGTGGSASGSSGRLAYHLGLQGPALTIDTACSSSLVAVHTACQNLRDGTCSMALAGGVNLILSPEIQTGLAQAGMLAPDGRCKTFDATADGYVRAEGCAIIVLKPLDAAIRDGNSILGTIQGSAVVQDGNSGGLTVPNRLAQEQLIRTALQQAGLKGSDLAYVEAHGTGTALGDPIEADAWTAILQADGRTQPLPIGSIKTNMGHAEAAAGIAGLMKALLVLQHRQIPPHLHFSTPNPHINWEDARLKVPTTLVDFHASPHPLHVAVSSFGFTGTLAEVILTEAPIPAEATLPKRSHWILKLSAREPVALQALVVRWVHHLEKSGTELGAYCLAANVGRQDDPCRAAFVARDLGQLQDQLKAWRPTSSVSQVEPKVALLFTGQGAQYPDMARQLYADAPEFQVAMDECEEIYQELTGGESLLGHVFSPENPQDIHQTRITQPALFAVAWSLWRLWSQWGLQPAAVMGHSIGEYVAATVAGIFSMRDAMTLVAARGKLMQSLPPGGAMASLFAPASQVAEWCQGHEGEVSIAAYNGASQVVVSGKEETVQAIVQQASASQVRAVPLQVSHAFHSPLMEPILQDFQEEVRQVMTHPPQLPLVSNVTADWITPQMAADPAYWAMHIRQPVRFHESVQKLSAQGCTHFLEIGPGSTLMQLAQQALGPEAHCLSSLQRGEDNWLTLFRSLASLYQAGIQVDWKGWSGGYKPQAFPLPNYPFQTQAYWIDEARSLPFDAERQLARNLYAQHWQPFHFSSRPPQMRQAGRYLLLGGNHPLVGALRDRLEAEGDRCHILPWTGFTEHAVPQAMAALGNEGPLVVAHLGVLDEAVTGWESCEQNLRHTLVMVQALARQGTPLRLLCCTAGAVSVAGDTNPHPLQASLWGMMAVVHTEQPHWSVQVLDLEVADAGQSAEMIEKVLLHPIEEFRLALRQGKLWKARLGQASFAPVSQQGIHQEIALQPRATYLVTGGSGALGRQVLGWLASVGATDLLILAYSQPRPAFIAELQAWEQKGLYVRYVQVDVGDAEALRETLSQIDQSKSPVRGIFHLAGRLRDRRLGQQQPQDLREVVNPKLGAAWTLHETSQALGWKLDFFVVFSSVAAFFGSPGQAGYAAANAGLDALASYRRGLGLAGQSIQWGPWGEAGMAVDIALQQRLQQFGIRAFEAATCLSLLDLAMRTELSQVAAVNADWQAFAAFLTPSTAPYYEALLDGYDPLGQASKQFKESFSQAYARDKAGLTRNFVELVIAQVLGHAGVAKLDAHRALTEQGFDSLLALRFSARLNELLGLELPATLVYLHPRLPDLVERIKTELEPRMPAAEAQDVDLEDADIGALLAQELQEYR